MQPPSHSPLYVVCGVIPSSKSSKMANELKPREQYLVGLDQIREATTTRPSQSKIYRIAIAKDGFPTSEHKTLHELFQTSVKTYSKEPLLGWRPINEEGKVQPFEWLTYEETGARVDEVSSGLAALGLQTGQRVGVYGVNCPEWMIAMQVCVWCQTRPEAARCIFTSKAVLEEAL